MRIIGIFIIFLITAVSLPAQNVEYDSLWKELESFEKKGLTRSAKEVAQKIYEQSKKDKNYVQQTKALIYQINYQAQVEENSDSLTIRMFEAEIETSMPPHTQILHSLLASAYQRYFQNNRYKIYGRTAITAQDEDFQTWDASRFQQVILNHFSKSLNDSETLKKIPVRDIEPLLITHEKSPLYRPTLFDLLGHHALDYFSNSESRLAEAKFIFEPSAEDLLSNASDFSAKKFETPDSLSRGYAAVQILQDLLQFHGSRKDTTALVDVDLKRLKFAKNFLSRSAETDSMYLSGLQNLLKNTPLHPSSTELMYEIAQMHVARADNYRTPENTQHQWEKKRAWEICQKAIKAFPQSTGAANCKALQTDIESHSISLTVEDISVPNKPFRVYMKYKNVEQVYFRIIREKAAWAETNLEYSALIEALLNSPPVKEWSLSITNLKDFQFHSTEVKASGVPAGSYRILASLNPTFDKKENILSMASFQTSQISYLHKNGEKGSLNVAVYNRLTGKPLKEAIVQRYSWSYRNREAVSLGDPKKTDAQGFVSFPYTEHEGYEEVEIRYKNERFRSNDRIYGNYYPTNEPVATNKAHFFTDRKIYRPGQTIYFKAIAIEQTGKKHTIRPSVPLTITFFDVNYQKVSELKLTTNDYGTVSGSFIAPSGGLLGTMRLETEGGSTNFSVEEYKRPRFEVTFNPVKEEVQLGDTIQVTGQAISYAGANLDGATVNYRVTRTARFPYWYGRGFGIRPPYYPSSEREVAQGTAVTDRSGKFVVPFEALADKSIPADQKPIFTYSVSADVVDITGETHSASTSVQAGYVGLEVSIDIPKEINIQDSIPGFKLTINNLNGSPTSAEGKIMVRAKIAPTQSKRHRRWAMPDMHILSKEAYQQAFPYDPYGNENDPNNWPDGKTIVEKTFDSEVDKSILLPELAQAEPGVYVLELTTKDKTGQEIVVKKQLTINDPVSKKMPTPEFFDMNASSRLGKPGETVSYTLKTTEKKVWVRYELQHKDKIIAQRLIKVKRKKPTTISIPITEAHRDELHANFSMVYQNQAITKTHTIVIHKPDTKLQLSWSSFRSKLLPGQKEQWKLKIAGPNGDKVAAELVATLYDASLDVFRANAFSLPLNSFSDYRRMVWSQQHGFGTNYGRMVFDELNQRANYINDFRYDRLNTFSGRYGNGIGYAAGALPRRSLEMNISSDELSDTFGSNEPSSDIAYFKSEVDSDSDGVPDLYSKEPTAPAPPTETPIQVRSNLNETAFFFPQLETNEAGEVVLDFTIPEALTRWKFLGLAHTKDLQIGQLTDKIITQKELMVTPNVPRFFREGDKMTFSTKINNLSEKLAKGTANLVLLDAFSMKPVEASFQLRKAEKTFVLPSKQSTAVTWDIKVPEGVQAVVVRVTARAGEFSDGEEHVIPVLNNRMLVTESMPLAIRGREKKLFRFRKLTESDTATTLKHQQLTLEFTSNPAWYAVQALPYLMEYTQECTEQIFSRFYSNALASHIAQETPKIQQVFEQWKNVAPDDNRSPQSLLSNLEKNQELKSVLLEETPWVLNAQDESERKRRVGLLFDLSRMSNESTRAQKQLMERQNANGAFSWFPGMRDNRYITQLIVTGMGHLKQLGVSTTEGNPEILQAATKSLPYLDQQILRDYNNLKRYKADLSKDHLSTTQIQYLYMRSFFIDQPIAKGAQEAFDYYYKQGKEFWLQKSPYMQGMLSLVYHRNEDTKVAKGIIASLKENAVYNNVLGMYWKTGRQGGYYWYEAPIEKQALFIEAFDEVTGDQKSVEEMKIWLLKNKQTNDWKTTRATVAACNALLKTGGDWLSNQEMVDITVGGEKIDPFKRPDSKVEAGTGYFKTTWTGAEIKASQGRISLSKKDDGIAWGALYWQYLEQLDKITYASTPLSLDKELFVEKNSDAGPVLLPLKEASGIKQGDKVTVKIVLKVDRDMEYVHMKDLRAAGFEPIDFLSAYKYKSGLGYYQSPKDAATHFFFDRLPKGTHVFEYSLRATQAGDFSNGVTTIQCMYAPEFTSHSEGIRVEIKE